MWSKMQGPFLETEEEDMNHMIVRSVRHSIDIDGRSQPDRRQDYEMGLQMVGKIPHEFEGMRRYHAKRRAPKTTICAPWESVREIADSFPYEEFGFSWREYDDATIEVGDPRLPSGWDDQRWEGIPWTWHR